MSELTVNAVSMRTLTVVVFSLALTHASCPNKTYFLKATKCFLTLNTNPKLQTLNSEQDEKHFQNAVFI